MSQMTLDRSQFDIYNQPILRQKIIDAIAALGLDASNTMEVTIRPDSVCGIAFVRSTEGHRILAIDGYLKFDFTAPIEDEEQ